LGLEHSGIPSVLSLETLRSAGTESPSGRLVVDLERLRQNRATSNGLSDITVVKPADVSASPATPEQLADDAAPPIVVKSYEFPRVNVPVSRQALSKFSFRKQATVIGAALAVLLLIGLALVLNRPGDSAAPLNAASEAVNATPSPEASPSPSPTPTPTPRSGRETKRNEAPPKKKQSKIGSAFGKVKRIFKNPF